MEPRGTIVFSSGRAGDYDIWTLDLPSLALRQLTRGDSLNDQPSWSPDGQLIAFISNRSGVPEIWLMAGDGTDQRPLTRDGRFHASPTWSPDGRAIVSCSNAGDVDEIEIFRFPLDGHHSPELLYAGKGIEMDASLSPDGRSLLYSSRESGNFDIWEYSLERKTAVQLTADLAYSRYPAYSPDGSKIAYVSSKDPADGMHDKDSDIWLMNRDGSGKRRIAKGSYMETHVAWSPDGSFIVYTECENRQDSGRLRILNVATGDQLPCNYSREVLEREIGASVKPPGVLSRVIPEVLRRRFYEKEYFGGERHPHWKR